MAILTVNCVTINALDPRALAGFWSGLVGGTPRDTGNGYVLVDSGQGGVPLLFQRADEPTRQPGWIHLDCDVADRAAAVDEIRRLGGRLIEQRSDSNGSWTVMADPEGNPFCI
jgi:predicted enzyme related to lactoylglutathione lyase